MDVIQVILIIFFAVGLFLMIFMFLKLRSDDDPSKTSFLETGNSIKAINSSIDEAEKVIEELNKFSASVLNEINAKHQELLFIYNLIDEKKAELKNVYNFDRPQKPSPQTQAKDRNKPKREPFLKENDTVVSEKPKSDKQTSYIHPKHKEIAQMSEEGLTITEISKNLGLGQGEVKLILELIKAR